jgi:hypothetical protein
MILPITDDWRINSDRHQWIIEQRHVSEGDKHKGKEYWQPKGYYTSIEAAIFELHQLRLRLSNVDGVVEATNGAKRLAQEIQDALSPKFKLAVNS